MIMYMEQTQCVRHNMSERNNTHIPIVFAEDFCALSDVVLSPYLMTVRDSLASKYSEDLNSDRIRGSVGYTH
jgi:hypothetical protein